MKKKLKTSDLYVPTPTVTLYFRSSYVDEIMRVDRIARDEFELDPIMDDNKSVVALYSVPINIAVHLAAVIGDTIIPEVIPTVEVHILTN